MRGGPQLISIVALAASTAVAPTPATAGTPGPGAGAGPRDVERTDRGGAASEPDPGDGELAEQRAAGADWRPAMADVLVAAYAAAGLDRDPGPGWTRRARLAGLVPWVTVRATRDTSWQDSDPEVGHSETVEVRATWRLDRLLFDGRELQVADLAASRRRERRRLEARVIRAYFAWRRLSEVPGTTPEARDPTRTSEAIAELDAATDGWFSAQLARHGRLERRAGARPP
jgi:hypothetical protein